ncbi:MAG: thioredoxin-disulfide reductase [Alphaproteobacteria bacterium]|nr:MAG: thioredoxin-disulfide reductase [Alphaproteobacteria bacterium]TAF12753.1 MAG: thioredoxin-disulfide reductase [Alphaproteobacteria bacterium]TAF41965.1 MAG: thioredoxin-disulfide reductase [Alphaproteobacteria bacterium]TAF76573.1 MAG: thioredoxin-disulfide reductase [Alphaproteobacteria bacterium]
MSTTHACDVLIIGSGAAGCTAAIYAARAGKTTIMVHGMQPGGQLTITTDVENYPGFAHPVQGPWLMQQMEEQAAHVGATIIADTIIEAQLPEGGPFLCIGDSGDHYVGKALIIATGASARWLGLESEKKFQNFGVSACATCDGFFFRNKPVAVIGGGNSAVEEALYLAQIASHVTLIHRRDSLRAEHVMQQRLFAHEKISVIWDHVVDEFVGTDAPPSLTTLNLKHVTTGVITPLAVDGAFVAIGHVPNTWLFPSLDKDESGYLITASDSTKTNIAGVFAAGDVQDAIYRQAVTAAGTGCMAALEADRFLATHGL